MGLLDEAIREHLELKRRRGADPSAVARQEREALTDAYAEEPADVAPAADDVGAHFSDEIPEQEDSGWVSPERDVETAPVAAYSEEHRLGREPPAEDLAHDSQETAELDMKAVLEEGPSVTDSASPVGPISEPDPADTSETAMHVDEALGWEMPGERENAPAPEEIPGQERMTFE